MQTTLSRYGALTMAIAVCTTLGACKSRSNYASSDTTSAGAAATRPLDTTAAGGAVSPGSTAAATTDTANKSWTDTDILAYLDAANTGEIDLGKLAQRRATNPAVKAFARQMVTDHTALKQDGKKLASQLKVDVATSTNGDVQDLAKNNKDDLTDLTNKTAGSDWDKDYIDKQIDAHQKVIDHVNDFMKATQTSQLQQALQQALPKLQAHLDSAQAIKNTKLTS